MTEEDYHNLHFLLSISNEEFEEWWETIDQEDRDYALSILKVAEHEIIEKVQEKTGTLEAASEILSRFTNSPL